MRSTEHDRIDLVDVSLRLGNATILDKITLRANQRRIAIVGRNGSGKTTLARVLAGLQAPDSGQVLIGGQDLASDRRAAIRAVGIIFQNPDYQIIFPTVAEEIRFGLTQLGTPAPEADAAVTRMLDRFGKADWADRAIQTLSQGQKQLVCLMAVLVMQPALIILDEPYSGLDIPTRMQMMRYVAALPVHVVQITHDPANVADFDRVLWLDQGAVRLDGPADTVLPVFADQMARWGDDDDRSDFTG